MEIVTVKSKKHQNDFIDLPIKIYSGNKYWVQPLSSDIRKKISNANPNILSGKHVALLLYKNSIPYTRIYLGINDNLNRIKEVKTGYISLFETYDDIECVEKLFAYVKKWFVDRGIRYIRGPVSISGAEGDENKGLLIDAFDKPPVIMNSYNPSYYKYIFERIGWVKDYDVFAYYMNGEKVFNKKTGKVIEYAKKKYGYRLKKMNLKKKNSLAGDIKYILDRAVPKEWPDLTAPDLLTVKETIKSLKKYADRDLLYIARDKERAIGFGVAIPDYNMAIKHLKGRITIFSTLKYLYYKRRIDFARMFIIFVIPEYRNKAVSYALCYSIFNSARRKGYKNGEGSTIGEDNTRMRRDIESIGGEKYKTYRIYKYEIR